jgi:hypothetical protein
MMEGSLRIITGPPMMKKVSRNTFTMWQEVTKWLPQYRNQNGERWHWGSGWIHKDPKQRWSCPSSMIGLMIMGRKCKFPSKNSSKQDAAWTPTTWDPYAPNTQNVHKHPCHALPPPEEGEGTNLTMPQKRAEIAKGVTGSPMDIVMKKAR